MIDLKNPWRTDIQTRIISKQGSSERSRRTGAVLSKWEPLTQNGKVRTYAAPRENMGTNPWNKFKCLRIFRKCKESGCTPFFYMQRFFSIWSQCCLTFSWIELQLLRRCCLIPITIIIMRHILYLVYLCPYLRLGLFILYLCDLSFIFSLIFIVIHYITSFK